MDIVISRCQSIHLDWILVSHGNLNGHLADISEQETVSAKDVRARVAMRGLTLSWSLTAISGGGVWGNQAGHTLPPRSGAAQ